MPSGRQPLLFFGWAEAEGGHEAAGERPFAAVAEEQACVASSAEITDENILGLNACRQELREVGFAKIEVDVFWRRLVARRLHVEPLEGIRLFTGARLVEIVGSVGELRGEFGDEVGSHFVTAWTNRRADGGQKILGLARQFEFESGDR